MFSAADYVSLSDSLRVVTDSSPKTVCLVFNFFFQIFCWVIQIDQLKIEQKLMVNVVFFS